MFATTGGGGGGMGHNRVTYLNNHAILKDATPPIVFHVARKGVVRLILFFWQPIHTALRVSVRNRQGFRRLYTLSKVGDDSGQ